MGNQEIQLRGIDVTPGNRRREKTQLFLPVCIQLSTGRHFAVRGSGWSLDPEKNIDWFDGERKLPVIADELDLPRQVLIEPGQQAVLMGPDAWGYLSNIAPSGMIEGMSQEWISLPDGFDLKLMSLEEYNKFQDELWELAVMVFDREVCRRGGKDLTSDAQSALELIKTNPLIPSYDKALRVIAGEGIIALNKRLLAFSQMLGDSPVALRDAAAKYLEETIDRDSFGNDPCPPRDKKY
jgi:hypothetical protein